MGLSTANAAAQRRQYRPEFANGAMTIRATDPVAYSRAVTDWSHNYEQLCSGEFTGELQAIVLNPVQIALERIGCAFRYTNGSWPGARIFSSAIDVGSQAYFDGRPIGGASVISLRWDAVQRVHAPRPTRFATVAIDEVYLQRRLSAVLGSEAPDTLPALTVTEHSPRTASMLDCVMDIVREVDSSPQLIADERAAAEYQGRIVDSLITLLDPRDDSRRHLPPPTTRAYVVRKAAEIMEARIADPISLSDLCEAIRVCPRTLRYSFEEVTGVSPMQYLLSLRLNGVRRDLSRADLDSPVQIVATRWGFWHLSRFARYYRIAFGERPSDTAARASSSRRAAPRPV